LQLQASRRERDITTTRKSKQLPPFWAILGEETIALSQSINVLLESHVVGPACPDLIVEFAGLRRTSRRVRLRS
jgi:hypothetical protein